MTRPLRRRGALAGAAVVTALVLGACTAGADAEAGADPEPWEWVYGPLEEFLVRIGRPMRPADDREEFLERSIAQSIEVDELVAACMAEQGFTYFPAVPVPRPPATAEEDIPPFGTREFAERWGLGFSTIDWDSMVITTFEDSPEQEAMLEAMSDAERRAWEHALWGGMLYEGVFDPEAGCRPQAQDAVWRFSVHQAFGSVQREVDQLHDRAEADPRLVAAHHEWSQCIALAGHPDLTRPQDLQLQIAEAWDQIQPHASPAEFLAWDFEAHPGGPPAPPIDPDAVARFAEREIAAAVADLECRQEAQVDAVRTKVLLELQRDLVERFGPELEAWATAVEEDQAR